MVKRWRFWHSRPRRWLLAVAAVSCALSLADLWRTPVAQPLRMRVAGYDGCACPDCLEAFALLPPPVLESLLPWRPGSLATLLTLAALPVAIGCAVLPPVRRGRSPDPWRCQTCGYDLRGLAPPLRCPECGRRARDAGG